jgi:integrase
MDFKTSIVKRGARKKTNRLKDGSRSEITVKGGWYYRISYVDLDGKPRTVERGPFDLKSHAKDALNAKLPDLRQTRGRSREAEAMTFRELAEICSDKLFHAPEYVNDTEGNRERISGVKSWKTVRSQLRHLKAFFGNRKINTLTADGLREYKTYRRKQTVDNKEGEPIRNLSLATVNRELATLRRILRYARTRGWIVDDIFAGAGVIEVSKEKERKRILSPSEEIALLNACQGEWETEYTRKRKGKSEKLTSSFTLNNRHLRAILILAIDSGLRMNEILKLRWSDIDLTQGLIEVIGTHTKTEKSRTVPLSARAKDELEYILSIGIGGDCPFPFTTIKRSFATAKRLAKIDNLRFHDLRSTAASRMSKAYPIATVAQILGHADVGTTMKYYISNPIETVLEVKDWLDRASTIVPSEQETLINGGEMVN